ncbi:MAG: Ferric uptake regulation protein [Firmicutes bacterium ADurb.Bin373]|jgi:Fur family ferric uptake transcriptional regulator|nr:transcriptional repressor [Bacillota bacterium]OQA08557.1 MAG: Ferric uptake regulation protein [Firmicutes bacterium ADurb.Bin373]
MKRIIFEAGEKLKAIESKLTARRELTLRVLLENRGKHLSAEEVYNLVKRDAADVGLATVYRALELFQEVGLIHAIDFGDGRKRYDFGMEDGKDQHHHHHLICTKCGRIIEFNEDLLDEIESKVNKKYNFTIINHQLKIFGVCSQCAVIK